ncbi:MAG: TonB-dependent receptor [Sphingomonadaceae bacterium]|nr:TonB-dependent receptor [Sphingomonadaceae bacterium]
MRPAFTLAVLLATTASSAYAAEASSSDPVADTIVVTARRANETARDEQRLAPNLINIQAAEDIVKYPDFNAAESLSRIPGVSLAIDTGEGRFVAIRGLDSNFNGTTFGGVTLLNTQPGGTYFGGGGRAVELDTIPIGSVDRIIVRKTGLPDQEAEGLGGSVELSPRSAAGLKKPFFEATLAGGYESFRNNGDVFNGEGAVGTAFGPDRQFAIVLSGSYHTDKRAFDDIEPGPADSGTLADGVTPDPRFTNPQLGSVDLRRYNYNRRRFGFGGELDWDPNPQSHYYIRANDAGYTESVNRSVLQYRGLDNSVADPANRNGFIASGVSARSTLRDEQETHINFVAAAGGRNDFGAVIIDYQGSYTAATYHRDYDYGSQFREPARFNVAYDNVTNYAIPVVTPIGFDPNNAAQFRLYSISNTTERAFDREEAGSVNITVPTTLLGGDGAFKVGGKLRFRDKIDSPINYSTQAFPTTLLSQVLGGGPYTDFYDGRYSVGYRPSAAAIRSIYNTANPAGALNIGGFFNDTENIYAGYAQYDGKFGKFGVLVGVRVENTDETLRGITSTTDAAGNTTTGPTSVNENYTNAFPTVQLRYEFTPQFIARATYSTGIGRPGFLQTTAGANVDVGNQSVSIGNPRLRPITANSFDASLEYYLPDAGILSIGFFDKELDNYILQRITRDPNYPGISGITTISTYSNVNGAYARGFEANYTQKFSKLRAPFDGLGFSGNITYVDSRVQIRDALTNNAGDPAGPLGASYSALPGTSKFTYNIATFYEAHKVQFRLSLLHVDAAIFQVGGADGLDVFEDARTTLDLTASYQVLPKMSVYFNAKNLLNTPLRYYEGYNSKTIQREYYDISYEAGVRLAF